MSDHSKLNPDTLPRPTGYTHGILAQGDRLLYLAGQIGCGKDGIVVPGGLVAQFDKALQNILTLVRAAGGAPESITRMTIYTTDMAAYRASLAALGVVWRPLMGRHYPVMAVLGVSSLFDPAAVVEIEATAVLS